MDPILYFVFLLRSIADPVFDMFRVSLGGMDMTAGALFNLAALATAVVYLLVGRGSRFALKVWLPYLAIATVSIFWSTNKGEAVRALSVYLTYACFFLLPFVIGERARTRVALLDATIYSSILPVLWGVIDAVQQVSQGGRVKSVFLHPNVFAFYLVVIIAAVLFLRVSSATTSTKSVHRWSVPYVGLMTGLVLLTQCRSAWAAVFLLFGAYAAVVDRRFLAGLFALPLLLLVPAVSERLSDLDRGTTYTEKMGPEGINSYAWRRLMWDSALQDAADEPLFGKGLATLETNSLVFFPLRDPSGTYSHRGIGAHSVYVQTIYEIGYVGLCCFLSIFVFVLLRAFRNRRRDPHGSVMLVATVGSYLVICYSDNILDYGALNLYFWGFIGTVLAKWNLMEARASARTRVVGLQSRLVLTRCRPGTIAPWKGDVLRAALRTSPTQVGCVTSDVHTPLPAKNR